MPKTISLQDAQDQLAAATATVDQLKAKILNEGPGSVTAEELGRAALDAAHAGLGWTQASIGLSDAIHVDGRRIASINPGVLVAAALTRAARQAGVGVGHLRPSVDVTGAHQGLTDNPEAWLHSSY